jgi:hypothetical protein
MPGMQEWSNEDIQKFRSMIGGKTELVEGALPALVFVTANWLWSLTTAAIVAGALAVAFTAYRVSRRQDVKRSIIGLVSLGVAVGIALVTKSASAYFVPGVIMGGILGLLLVATIIVRQPVSLMFAMALEKESRTDHSRPEVLRAHMIVTGAWAFVTLGRAALRAWLIAKDEPELLGATAVFLGYPLTLALAAGSVLYLRRRSLRLVPEEPAPEEA